MAGNLIAGLVSLAVNLRRDQTMSIKELGERAEFLKQETVRLSRHPARVHGMTEDEHSARLLDLNDELRLVQGEIEHQAQATWANQIRHAYGRDGQEVSPDAKAELKQAQDNLEKVLEGFSSQTRGYALKVHQAQIRVFEAASKAGEPVRREDMVLSGLAQKLAAMVEQAVKYGN